MNNSFHYLTWESPPKDVLVIKNNCISTFESFIEIIDYIIQVHDLNVYIEEKEFENELFSENETIKKHINSSDYNRCNKINPFLNECVSKFQSSPMTSNKENEYDDDTFKIDFIICLGGDGTLLHASSIFQKTCPPVVSIHSGLLGFLCPFSFSNFKEYLPSIIQKKAPLLFRNRLKFKIKSKLSNSVSNNIIEDEAYFSSLSGIKKSFESLDNRYSNDEMISLNEIVVNRGPSSHIAILELFVNDYLITTIQGDGVIISTPTGTTAYAMAAGASLTHPSVPAIIITPICPQSLSFRPIVVPAGVKLKIQVSPNIRHTAWYSVDGSENKELLSHNYIEITTSKYQLASICRHDQINDWFEGLATCLKWNTRKSQLPLNSCYLNKSNENILNHESTNHNTT